MKTSRILKSFASAMVLAAVSSTAAHAAEGSIYGGPIGGTDIRNAYLPAKPGLYLGLVSSTATADQSYNNVGVNRALDVEATAQTFAASLTYVYPVKLFGGTIATSAQANFQVGHLTINAGHDPYHGVGDVYSDLLAWSRYVGPVFGEAKNPLAPKLPYGLTVKAAYSMIFPTGKYTPTEPNYPGHEDFFFIPNFAASYLTQPNALGDGVEFSAHVFADFASENPKTHYHSGPVIDTDFAVTERRGRWQGGLQGYYSKQVGDDFRNDVLVQPDGKRLMVFYLGPVIAFDMPKQRATVRLKVTFPVEVRNTLNVTRYILGYSIPL
jgi:hypothetical protein